LPRAGNPAGIGGSADTGAWARTVADNRVKVADALTAERSRLAALTDAEEIARSQARIKLYEDILANDRQILKFDPSGNGRIAELVGHIEPGTRNVGLFVPGVNTQMSNFDAYAGLGRSMVAADPTGRTAMVVWADGVFPQNPVVQGPSASYAEAMAPDLKHFTDDLRGEIAGHAGSDVTLTAIGHSYGGATVGLAETQGLDVDRVLHVESASQAGVQRFSMTAPLDPIEVAQGNAWGLEWTGIGHGADPDTFPGVTELETGRSADGDQLWGLSSHSDVLKPGSESWTNMYRVVTGGPTTANGTFDPDGILENGVEFLDNGGVLR
jgi:hypothetical protein